MKGKKPKLWKRVRCSFCKASTIHIRETVVQRGLYSGKKLLVHGGKLIMGSMSNRTPICDNCLNKSFVFLKETADPLRALLVTEKSGWKAREKAGV